MLSNARVLVLATGAANVVRLPELLAALRAGAPRELNVVLSASAERIIRPETARLFCDNLYAESDPSVHFAPGHMGLALSCDVLAVLPATAQTIASCAQGGSDRLVSEIVLGHPGPAIFFPSMNRHMWANPATIRNVAQLRGDGHIVVEPVVVRGFEIATGQMVENPGLPDPQEILRAISQHVAARAGSAA